MKERLKQILEARNMRSAQLAQAAGLSTSTVDDIIKGKTNELNIGVDKMLKIANALGVSVESLYDRDDPNKKASPHVQTLTEGETILIELFRQIPEDAQKMYLEVLRASLKNQ